MNANQHTKLQVAIGASAECGGLACRTTFQSAQAGINASSGSGSAAVDHAAATARRCARAEQVVLTALAAMLLVLFCLRSACVACEQAAPAPAAVTDYGWPA
ncbi:MAG: hypothetical protein EOO78_31195 [Oxalobacteraceae bacterium]|nr:MAG: hypothetical protein EOO78_31195 [Oxalobacteraceae bacterium]